MSELILMGGGGHCRSAIDVIEAEGSRRIMGVLEDPAFEGSEVMGYPILGTDDALADLVGRGVGVLVTIGQIKTSKIRERAFAVAKKAGASLPVIVSPNAYWSRHATVGAGTMVMHGAVVNAACGRRELHSEFHGAFGARRINRRSHPHRHRGPSEWWRQDWPKVFHRVGCGLTQRYRNWRGCDHPGWHGSAVQCVNNLLVFAGSEVSPMADTRTHRALIIAEAGVNHDGNIEQALRLIDVAADAGADLVKFQTFDANALATANAELAAYQEQASELRKPISRRAIGDVAALTAQRARPHDLDRALRGPRHWILLNGVRFREPRLPRSPWRRAVQSAFWRDHESSLPQAYRFVSERRDYVHGYG